MPIIYDNKKIIPAPAVEISREFNKNPQGEIVGTLFKINLTGKLVAFAGSPQSDGTFWTTSGSPANETIPSDERLKSLLKKQEALRNLFSVEGKTFEIQPLDGSASTKCNPRIGPLVFTGADPSSVSWYDTVDYTLELETDCLFGPLLPSGEFGCATHVSEISEDWSIEFGQNDEVFNLTHNISAVGKRHYDEAGSLAQEPWKNARDVVHPLMGIDQDRITASGVLNLDNTYSGFNHRRSENVGVSEGRYSVTETWVVASGNVIDDYTVNTVVDNQEGTTQITVDGTITGLDTRDSDFNITQSKYNAARQYFDGIEPTLLSRAQDLSGETPTSAPVRKTIGRNILQGTISYSYEYDNNPDPCTSGAISESIEIIENYAGDVFASIPVLGRAAGPVLQDINTVTQTSRQLSIELVMPKTDTCSVSVGIAAKPDVSSIVSGAKPVATQVFKESDQEGWNWRTGRYTRNITWVYQ